MAKAKKTSKKSPPPEENSARSRWEKIADSRIRMFSPDDLKEKADELSSLIAELNGSAEAMTRMGVEALKVNGATQIGRAIKELQDFLGNLGAALAKEKFRRG